ncbi:MAG: DUF4242 domain-containing protein [Myxococcales bacterium]|nr:DUF4242 domain-containing protein [Myxococcales bacterium]
MGLIVVERSFEEPRAFEDMDAAEAAVSWCFEQHRVKALRSFLSRNRRHMVCVYDAPDAEAVRKTQLEAGLPHDAIWASELLEPPEREQPPGYSAVIVQRQLPGKVDAQGAWALFELAVDCLGRHRAKLWHSYLSKDGTRMVCRFYAPDAEGVRRANQESELPFVHIWPAIVYGDSEG